jgi:hypothetical protein
MQNFWYKNRKNSLRGFLKFFFFAIKLHNYSQIQINPENKSKFHKHRVMRELLLN